MELNGKEQIIPTILEDEMRSSYLDYSMSVIVSRALPDVRDGLKPVHRRILYAMNELGMQPNKPYKKSARLVGEVLGKYHPHGDTAVYDSMVRMAQTWSLRYPLVNGQGNFGSIDGDNAAAMRYTEARMSSLATQTLVDIDKDTIDFRPNFDETLKEPVVLPTIAPLLMINGASGIAVGMATNIPPHNLGEVVRGIIELIKNPYLTSEELMQNYITAPDFPTGGIIYGYEGVKNAYTTGRGKIILRAKAFIEEKKSGKTSIIINELPYQVNKSSLIEKIAALVRNKSMEGISDIRDESDRDGIRIVIEIKRDAVPSVVLNNLYKHTQLQVTFGAIMLALVNGRPKVLTLREMLQHFIDFRNEVVVRRTRFELDAAEKRAHILEGFIIALDNIDAIIKTIKASPDVKTASSRLQEKFGLSEIQAKAILEMRLQKLTGLEREKIQEEYKDIIQKIEKYKTILASKELQLQIVSEELSAVALKYRDERRTEIIRDSHEFKIEDVIANEDVIITITHQGNIKRTPVSNYRRQHKGGRGLSGAGTNNEDFVEHVFQAATHHNLLFFTDKGRCFSVKVYQLPEGSRNAKGRSIVNVIAKQPDENVTAFLPVKEFDDEHYIFMTTKHGTVKKTELSKFAHVRANGIIAMNLTKDDLLISARITDGQNDIIIGTRNGIACRFRESDVRAMGRTAQGVRGIKLIDDDYVISMVAIKRSDAQILVVGELGYGKRTKYEAFRLTRRGAKGVISMNVTEKTGKVVGMLDALDTQDLVVITQNGILIRQPIKDIRVIGRNTQGVKLIRLEAGDRIADITSVSHKEDVEKEDDDNTDEGEVSENKEISNIDDENNTVDSEQ